MVQDEDYIDVSTKNISKLTPKHMTPEQIEVIMDNPQGLTREGAEYQLWLWFKSSNKYMKKQYLLMLDRCKNFKQSGKTVDGKTIFSRRKGKITSYGDIDAVRKELKAMGVKY